MALDSDNWNLFGLDLSKLGGWISLGLNQLLYDQDSWLLKKFDQPALVMIGQKTATYQALKPAGQSDLEVLSDPSVAICLEPSDVLIKTLQLPAVEEVNLDAAVSIEAGLSSPFPEEATRVASRVLSRGDKTLNVAVAITSQSAIEQALDEARVTSPALADTNGAEVWALNEAGEPLIFSAKSNSMRMARYHRSLVVAGAKLGITVVSIFVALICLTFATGYRAEAFMASLRSVQSDAAETVFEVANLRSARERVAVVEAAIASRTDYPFWLNYIAASAPDTVYLDRLHFDGNKVTASGYSDNAAVYLRMLTEQSGYKNVTALSAFSRDQNTGLERFSIEWLLTEIETEKSELEASTASGPQDEGGR